MLPMRVIRGRVPRQPRHRLVLGHSLSLAEILFSAPLMGFAFSFAALLRPAGDGVFRRLGPTCRFTLRSSASFIVAGLTKIGHTIEREASASGILPRRAAVQ